MCSIDVIFNQNEETMQEILIIPLFLSISLYLQVAPACIEDIIHTQYNTYIYIYIIQYTIAT